MWGILLRGRLAAAIAILVTATVWNGGSAHAQPLDTSRGSAGGHEHVAGIPGPPTNPRARVPVAAGDPVGPSARAITERVIGRRSKEPAASSLPLSSSPNFTVGRSFSGSSSSTTVPPDTSVAAGPTDLVEATNADVQSFTKVGVQEFDASLGGFFSSVAGDTTNIFDPQVVYDPYVDRFWVSATANNDSKQESKLLVAVSTSSNASSISKWTFFALDATLNGSANSGYGCDRDSLGYDAQAIYLTCNMISFPLASGSFQYAKIRVMTTGQFLSGACCYWWDFWNLQDSNEAFFTNSYTIQPARMRGAQASTGEFLSDAHGEGGFSSNLEVIQITSPQACCVPGNQASPLKNQTSRSVNGFSVAPSVIQPTPNSNIDPGDTGLDFAIWQNGTLSTAHDVACSSNSLACIAYTEINVQSFPTMSVLNDWQTGFDFNRYDPAVDANASGYKTMVYTRSIVGGSPPSVAVLSIPPSSVCTNCSNSETVTMAGAADYVNFANGVNRWGDYSGASVDPDGQGIWVAGEYAANSGANPTKQWGTQVTLTYEAQSARTWVQQTVSGSSPSARDYPSMTYDAAHQQTVLFGGATNVIGNQPNQTWTWDGTNWTQQNPVTIPTPRVLPGLVFDSAMGKVVRFGGGNGGSSSDPTCKGVCNDTWTWDGTNWTELFPKASPPARDFFGMVYDAKLGKVVIFGGYACNTANVAKCTSAPLANDTWTFDGTTWTQLKPTTSPSPRARFGMAYDAAHGAVIFGGDTGSQASVNETWTFDGQTWTHQNLTYLPPGRDYMGFAYDDNLGASVLFGGADGNGVYLNDTWTWDGTAWTNQNPFTAPQVRDNMGLAYDALTLTMVMSGGGNPSTNFGDTWTY